MKELEKTKRISISAVLFLLVILTGVLTFKKPQYVFDKDTATTLEEIIKHDYIVSQVDLKAMNSSKYILIDIRSNYEYAKGHINGAINITTPEILTKESTEFLNESKENGKTTILYGEHPDAANSVWMLLYQLGYENMKVLSTETGFANNQFQVKSVQIEKPTVNYSQVMKNSMGDKSEVTKVKKPKKVIITRKKKKSAPEGGC